jgi:DNA-binding Xre family transcriptional regulator
MIYCNALKVFTARGITNPYSVLVKNGFSPNIAHRYASGKVDQIRLSHLEKLCLILHCTPHDLLEWVPDQPEDDTENNPLRAIRRSAKTINVTNLLNKMPMEKLAKLEELLTKIYEDKAEGKQNSSDESK